MLVPGVFVPFGREDSRPREGRWVWTPRSSAGAEVLRRREDCSPVGSEGCWPAATVAWTAEAETARAGLARAGEGVACWTQRGRLRLPAKGDSAWWPFQEEV